MKSMLSIVACLGLWALGCVSGASAAEEGAKQKIAFQIDAPSLADALLQFTAQSKVQFAFSGEKPTQLNLPKVVGEYTAREALDRLLANSGLEYEFVNERTVSIRAARSGDSTSNAGHSGVMRMAQDSSSPPASARTSSTSDDKDTAEKELTVTGSRIRTMVGEQTLQPVFVMDRQAIERTGAANLGEVFKYIPQITSSSDGTGLEAYSDSGGVSPQPSSYVLGANLRGFEGTQTLILVDGRRVNKTSQVSINDRFDIIGLPLGSVDRIEVLLDGASAVYGADALAGVINIITRKDFNGTEARINYDNMFDTDASRQDYQLSHGISREKWNLNFSASHQRNTPLASRDLEKTRTNDRRAFGGTDGRSSSIRIVPGWIETVAVGGVRPNLPGLSTSRAPIPDNSSGVGLTVADYAAALAAVNALPRPWNPTATSDATAWGERWDSATVTEEARQRQNSFRINGEYSFNSAVSVYASVSHLESENTGTSASPYSTEGLYFNFDTDPPVIIFASGLTLPAGYPGNPFGVPIVLHKRFLDHMGTVEMERTNSEGVVGMRGDLPKGWRYDFSAKLLKSKSQPNYKADALLQANMQPLLDGANSPVLLYDSTRRSMPIGDLFYAANRPAIATLEKPESRTYTADAEGPIWRLPAGDVRLALMVESREDSHDTNADLLPPSNGYSFGIGAEVRVPIVSPQMKMRGLHRVDVGIAGRHDRYSEYPEATNPSYRLMVQPVSWLSLRATRSEGTRVPSLFISKNIPHFATEYDEIPADWVDPLRNNEPVQLPFTEVVAGNPNLEMEESVSYNYSITVDVPMVPGLSLTASRWTTDNFNRFAQVGDLFDFPDMVTLFPALIIREPSTGPLPGRITGRIFGYANLSVSEHAGWDAMARYNVDTALGMFDAMLNISKTTKNDLRVAGPGGDVTPGQSGVRNLPTRLNGSLFWSRGPVSAGANVTYNDARFTSTTSTVLIPGSTRWDLQLGYNFARAGSAPGGWLGALTRDTRVNLTVFNILNEDPPLVSGTYRFGTIERKQQRYAINFTRAF